MDQNEDQDRIKTELHISRMRRLKKLHEEIENIRVSQEPETEKLKVVSDIVKETNSMITQGTVEDRIRKTAEIVMNVQILYRSHEIFGELMPKITNSEFIEAEYKNALNRIASKDNYGNWDEIAEIAIGIALTTKFSPSLLGSVDANVTITEKEAKVRQSRSKQVLAIEKQPQVVEESEKQNKKIPKVNSVLKQIRKLYFENGSQPIPFYKLVIDPDNFMNTIDNVFQVSFLARDDNIAIGIGDDNLPTVRVIKNNEQGNGEDSAQAICSFNPNFVNEMIKMYKIDKAMLNVNRDEVTLSQPEESQRDETSTLSYSQQQPSTSQQSQRNMISMSSYSQQQPSTSRQMLSYSQHSSTSQQSQRVSTSRSRDSREPTSSTER